MSHTGASRHPSYHNRFRSTSTDDGHDHPTTPAELRLHSVSQSVDIFGHPADFGQLALSDAALAATQHQPPQQQSGEARQASICSQPKSPQGVERLSSSGQWSGLQGGGVAVSAARTSVDDSSMRPTAPGLPRRLSRQHSAHDRRQQFAATRTTTSGEAGRPVVTSVDSGCDDVFVEMAGTGAEAGVLHGHQYALHDSSLFPNKTRAHSTSSSSSTTPIMPNPYNRVNHRLHDLVWCCSCVYFVFFCCLPAIHFMEQSDVEFARNDTKRAQTLGRLSTFLYFTGTLIALSLFALIFFLAIFFSLY